MRKWACITCAEVNARHTPPPRFCNRVAARGTYLCSVFTTKTHNIMCNKHHHEHGHCHDNDGGCGCGCHHHHEENEAPMWRALLPMAVAALLLIVGIVANPLPAWPWAVFVLAYLPVGLPILKEAGEEIAKGDIFNEFTLMVLATIGAFAIGEYPEAVAVLLFYSVGEYFQDRAVGRARRDIQSLVNLRPDTATVIDHDGRRTNVKPDAVEVGSVIEVVAGERVPLDGTLLTERADFDTAALTGEAEPRSIEARNEVAAGMIAIGRVVRVRVLRPYAKSALQRIMTMVEDAASRKSHAEMFIRRFARVYTPVVIALAALIALVPPLLAGDTGWAVWLYRALVFLVISCPCALVVSVPLAYFRGIGVASRMGILFKGGNYLDAVARLSHVVFDKTGTLTTGQFVVSQVTCAEGEAVGADDLLRMVAAVERKSTHPVARAIVAAADSKGDTLVNAASALVADMVEEEPGLGLRGMVAGHELLVGKAALLEAHGIDTGKTETATGDTVVYCAMDGRYAGMIALGDQPRPEAAKGIERLHALGIKRTCVLSGDRSAAVERLAQTLGVDEWHADLLPEGKVEQMQRIKQQCAGTGKVAFVGDGINDAPVLAMSDVGFAMGGAGSDAAVETADVVIQSDNPSRVADAIMIGRRTRSLVRYNIALALGIKVAVMLAGALGYASLWAAVLADTGVALLCVANTYAIRSGKR